MFDKTHLKGLVTYALVIGLFILAFLVITPIIFSIIYGILFAYLVFPIYRIFSKKIKNETLAASLFCLVLLLILIFITFLFFQFMFRQTINFYLLLQKTDITAVITKAMPSFISSTEISTKVATTFSSALSNLIANFLNSITNSISNLPNVLLQISVVFFVFFFSLRDGEKSIEYLKTLSPLKKEVQDKFFKHFKDITNSVIVGHILIGVLQGITAGIGYFIFGVPNALLLTFITILAAIIPVIGPWIIWIPVDIYLFASGNSAAGLGFLIYGTILVSTLDNIVRPLVVSRGTEINAMIVLLGMIGGLFAFGIVGIILGPLVLAYVLLVIELYRKNTISDDLIFKKPE